MKMNYAGIRDKENWSAAGIALPSYDAEHVAELTRSDPRWVHFGIGNIFRIFIGGIADRLLREGRTDRGIICAETYDEELVDKIYAPHDNLVLSVILGGDGRKDLRVLGPVAEALKAGDRAGEGRRRLEAVFASPGLQMVSFTITEKGYALRGADGNVLPYVQADLERGPACAEGVMGILTAMLLARFNAGACPIALVSMDNVSQNGRKLKESVTATAAAWVRKGYCDEAFLKWLEDETSVTYPWTMIDKITPRPSQEICALLKELGVEDIDPVITAKHTYIAPYGNAEEPQYLVIEDAFPNGRPPLEEAGVYMTDRETVNKAERMKVTACLNPIHTALCTYAVMLGHDLFADSMTDPELLALAKKVGYDEGLPLSPDPGILSPRAFLDEVIGERFPNRYLGDTSARIAVDISQMTAIRFGETIRAAIRRDGDARALVGVPLAIAGWIRYLLAVDDEGHPYELSPDPMLPQLKETLSGLRFGHPESLTDQLKDLLSNPLLFGTDLYEAGIGKRIEEMVRQELGGRGAIRRTLKKYLKSFRYAIASPTSLGVRLTPPDRMAVQTSNLFYMQATSAETNVLNVAASLGQNCLALTRFVEKSPVADFIKRELRARNILYMGPDVPQDGPWGCRHQFNIADSGFGLRAPRVYNDRAGEVGRTLCAEDYDLDRIFAEDGVAILHISGLIAALSPETTDCCLKMVRKAKECGTMVSFDLNYRASFWAGREEELRAAFHEIAASADILIGNEEDFQLCLGFSGPEEGGRDLRSEIDAFKSMIGLVRERYPAVRICATTLREVITAEEHLWGAVLSSGSDWYVEEPRRIPVLDRIGGGDGFAGGLLYGVLKGWEMERCLSFGWAAGAMAAGSLHDYAEPADEKQLFDIYKGNARVQR